MRFGIGMNTESGMTRKALGAAGGKGPSPATAAPKRGSKRSPIARTTSFTAARSAGRMRRSPGCCEFRRPSSPPSLASSTSSSGTAHSS
jgi:hypothetical protein